MFGSFWNALQLAYTVIGWMFAAATEPVNAEVPVPDPQLTFQGKTFELAGAGGAALVIKRIK
jgi:hypothetical protein